MNQSPPMDLPDGTDEQPLLVCLLPARNAEQDLPGYLDNVSGFCDAIVALDDGSTDSTYEILNGHPLVKILLRNPRREDYHGWDDATNRNRLLEASEALNPQWIISLDADERLDDRDATSLREFLETDALPGCAYGFREVAMREDAEHFLPRYSWHYRVFSAEPGQRFPEKKLHLVPVPTSIPRYRWIKTTLRIQHFGSMTPDRRMLRFHKYLEADPNRIYQSDYTNLLETGAVEDVRRWQPRPESVPVLLPGGVEDEPDWMESEADPGTPALSAIIISRNNEATIARTVASVVNQEVPEPFEVIVVTSGMDRTAQVVRENFPSVTVVELDKPALPGEARNAGLAVARGSFVSFPGSHVELLPGSLAARLLAHRRGYAMVTGAVYNGTKTRAGWASYFLDQFQSFPGLGPSELNGPPAHCSYARLPLLEVGGFPEGMRTGEDTAVNQALVRRGYVAVRDPDVELIHRSPCTSVPKLLRHHFQRGRGVGRLIVSRHRETGGLLTREFLRDRLIEAVPTRILRIETSIQGAHPEIAEEYGRTRGLVALGAAANWVGMWFELLRPDRGKFDILLGQPKVNLLVASNTSRHRGVPDLRLVQIDYVSGEVTVQAVSSNLPVWQGSSTEPLSDLLAVVSPSQQELSAVRGAVSTALNMEQLECLIVPDDALQWPESSTPNGDYRSKTLIARILGGAKLSLAMVQAMARNRILSTMPMWQTVRVSNRLQAMIK